MFWAAFMEIQARMSRLEHEDLPMRPCQSWILDLPETGNSGVPPTRFCFLSCIRNNLLIASLTRLLLSSPRNPSPSYNTT